MRNTTIFILFWVFVGFFSCKTENPETDNIFEFKDYIYQTTAGTVSVNDPIIIGLQKEVTDWEDEQEVPANLLRILPKINGKLFVQGNKTLRFETETALQPDTEYSITVNHEQIYENVPAEFKKYNVAFKTVAPNFSIMTNDLQSYSKEWQYLNGVLRSADVIPAEKRQELLKVTQNGKELAIKWNADALSSTTYEFTIDSINRPIDDTEIQIS